MSAFSALFYFYRPRICFARLQHDMFSDKMENKKWRGTLCQKKLPI